VGGAVAIGSRAARGARLPAGGLLAAILLVALAQNGVVLATVEAELVVILGAPEGNESSGRLVGRPAAHDEAVLAARALVVAPADGAGAVARHHLKPGSARARIHNVSLFAPAGLTSRVRGFPFPHHLGNS
jgi:hypothetical protein